MLTMLCFGLGTVPAMLSLGLARTLARAHSPDKLE
jgi:sulfite exporter TauE/SafE